MKPKAKAYPKAIEAIINADLITIGPGDLYSSLVQILLTEGVPEAIRKSKAKKVYICNLMTKYGETNNFTVSDFVKEIEKYLRSSVDYVVYNTKKPSKKRLLNYKKSYNPPFVSEKSLHSAPILLDLVGINKELSSDKKFIGQDLLPSSGPIIHDPNKLAKIILNYAW